MNNFLCHAVPEAVPFLSRAPVLLVRKSPYWKLQVFSVVGSSCRTTIDIILTGFSALKLSHAFHHSQQSKLHQLSSSQPAQPKRMDPLLFHIVPQAVHLLPGLQCFWSIISMLGLPGFTVMRKIIQDPPKQPFVSMFIPRAHKFQNE
jgi:hypothetical protein